MKNLIYIWIMAGMLLFAACSDEDEFVFSQSPSERIQALQTECMTTLKGAENGWKLAYAPQEEYGSFNFVFRFKDKNRVDMISDFHPELSDYSYNLNLSESLVLTFDSKSPLHQLSDPQYGSPLHSGDKGYGLEADFEFIIEKIGAEEIAMLGKKTQKELKLTKATAADWAHVEKLGKISENFDLNENDKLVMTLNGVKVSGASATLDNIFRLFSASFIDGEGEKQTEEAILSMTEEGCRFNREIEVSGIKFSGLTVDLSSGFANREFVSGDEAQSIRYYILNLAPLNLTPEQVPSFEPSKNVESVDLLKTGNGEEATYIIADMSAELKTEWETLQAELPDFRRFSLEMNRKSGYEGSFRVTAVNAEGSEKSHNYDFGTFTLLNNSVNQVRFDNTKKSHSTSSGFVDKDLYAEGKNDHVTAIYDAFFSKKGFTVIRDTGKIFWIRSIEDRNVWMKLELE